MGKAILTFDKSYTYTYRMDNGSSKPGPDPFYSNKIISLPVFLSLLFLILALILVLVNFSQLPPEIPIFYSTKTQILGKKIFIWIMPALIFANLIVNLTISKIFLAKAPFLAKMLAATTAIVSFLVFWAELEIILLF